MTSLVAWQRGIGVRTVRQRVPISLQAVTFVPSVDCQGGEWPVSPIRQDAEVSCAPKHVDSSRKALL